MVFKLKDDDGNVYFIQVSFKYVLVQMIFDFSESINNMGNFWVDVLDVQNLLFVDLNGKSDFYCKFEFNGVEVFKIKMVKKMFNFEWKEFFMILIFLRMVVKFKVIVWDWDFVDKFDFFGVVDINFEQFELFRGQQFIYILDGKLGILWFCLFFMLDYVIRIRQGIFIFIGIFLVLGRIVIGVVGVFFKGGVVVGYGVVKGVFFLKCGFCSVMGRRDDDDEEFVSLVDIFIIIINGFDLGFGGGLKRLGGFLFFEVILEVLLSFFGDKIVGFVNGVGGFIFYYIRIRSVGVFLVYSVIYFGVFFGIVIFNVVFVIGFFLLVDVYVIIMQIKDGKIKQVGKIKYCKLFSGMIKFDEMFKIQCILDVQFKVEVKEYYIFGSDDLFGEIFYFVDEINFGQEKQLLIGFGFVWIRSLFVLIEEKGLLDSFKFMLGIRRSFLSKKDLKVLGFLGL